MLISSLFLPAIPASLDYSLKSKQKAHLCRCAFMLISGLFLPAIPANLKCKTKQKGPTIYMIDPF